MCFHLNCETLLLKRFLSNAQAHQLLMNFEEPLKDYLRAVQSIKVSLV